MWEPIGRSIQRLLRDVSIGYDEPTSVGVVAIVRSFSHSVAQLEDTVAERAPDPITYGCSTHGGPLVYVDCGESTGFWEFGIWNLDINLGV